MRGKINCWKKIQELEFWQKLALSLFSSQGEYLSGKSEIKFSIDIFLYKLEIENSQVRYHKIQDIKKETMKQNKGKGDQNWIRFSLSERRDEKNQK